MVVRKEKRITAKEALQHKWFKKFLADESEDKIERMKDIKIA